VTGHVFDPARGSVSAFLLGVARNHVLRRLRVEQLLTPLGDDFDDEDIPILATDTDLCPLEDLTRAETIESVRKAVLSLPAKYREVVVLVRASGRQLWRDGRDFGLRDRNGAFAFASRAGAVARQVEAGREFEETEFSNCEVSEVFRMNCQKFENVVSELARGQMMAASNVAKRWPIAVRDARDCATKRC
jgi:hypothetical protein